LGFTTLNWKALQWILYNIIAFIQKTPGGKSYDAALVVATALDQMIKDGLDVKETSLQFDFGGQITTKAWPPGQKLMEYIKNVSKLCKYKVFICTLHFRIVTIYKFYCVAGRDPSQDLSKRKQFILLAFRFGSSENLSVYWEPRRNEKHKSYNLYSNVVLFVPFVYRKKINYTELSISFPIHEYLNYKSFDYEAC